MVIDGWDMGIEGMKVGGLRRLIVPAPLAYAEKGKGKKIPPNSRLTFTIELMAVARCSAASQHRSAARQPTGAVVSGSYSQLERQSSTGGPALPCRVPRSIHGCSNQ